jgi:hypothetical protein
MKQKVSAAYRGTEKGGANDGSLEKRPDILHRVRVSITAHVFLSRVIDCLVPCVWIAACVVGGKSSRTLLPRSMAATGIQR